VKGSDGREWYLVAFEDAASPLGGVVVLTRPEDRDAVLGWLQRIKDSPMKRSISLPDRHTPVEVQIQ